MHSRASLLIEYYGESYDGCMIHWSASSGVIRSMFSPLRLRYEEGTHST